MKHFTAQIDPQKHVLRFIFLSFLILILSACGGEKGDGGGVEGEIANLPGTEDGGGLEEPVSNLSGTWKVTETTISNDCGDTNGISIEKIWKYVQDGNNITLTDVLGNVLNATISGNQVSVTGSFPDDGGTTTITNLVLTVSNDGKNLSGTSSWTWIDDFGGCQGETSITGTLITSNVNPVRNIAGTWLILEVIESSSCSGIVNEQLKYSVDISQNGTAITVTGPNTTIWNGIINGNTVSWRGVTGASKNVTRKNMSLILSTDGQSLEGTLDFESFLINDPTRICSGKNKMTGTKI